MSFASALRNLVNSPCASMDVLQNWSKSIPVISSMRDGVALHWRPVLSVTVHVSLSRSRALVLSRQLHSAM